LIPTGETRLESKDQVYLILTRDGLPMLRKIVSGSDEKVARLVIYGAGRIGVGLASLLEGRVEHVVVVEPDAAAAEQAAAQLRRSLVLRGAITDPGVLDEAKLRNADMFVATSNRDEMNLVAAALAHKHEGPRVAVVTADPDFVPALADLNLDLVVNERLITVDAILRFLRPGRYLAVKRLNEQGAEIMELSVQKGAHADGKRLRELRIPSGSLVVAVRREGQAILPDGNCEVRGGDTVILVALPTVREKAAEMFFHKRWLLLQKHHRR
jgi:trk system potassium uptake protein TrkA